MTDTIRAFVESIQHHWQSGDLASLAKCYDEHVVLLPPDMGEPIVGRDAVLSGYADFLRAASLERFRITDLAVYTFDGPDAGQFFAAHMEFELTYVLDGTRYRDGGLEVYHIVATENAPPRVLWRSQVVLDSESLSSTPGNTADKPPNGGG